ncbi:MAG: hypothetical protein ACKV0T_26135 [Planctomycetales bacterium]
MKLSYRHLLTLLLLLGGAAASRADEKTARATLDKGIKALGGEAKLAKAGMYSSKAKGKVSFGGNESDFTAASTVQGVHKSRNEFEGEFGGNKFQAVTVLNGDKGWVKFGEMGLELDEMGLAREKRNSFLQIVPTLLVPLNDKAYKLDSIADEKVADKPAAGIKVTGPDGKDFRLYFDKDSGLPVRLTATVQGFMGEEVEQEAFFSGYKEMGGIKKATKTETKRNGETFSVQEITEFKVLDKVPDDTFAEPK